MALLQNYEEIKEVTSQKALHNKKEGFQFLLLGSFLLVIGIIIISCVVFSSCSKEIPNNYEPSKLYARFMTNCPEEEIVLSSGFGGIGENTLFQKVEISIGDTISEPSTHPTRSGYDFVGWSLDKEGTELFDFSTPLTSGITLFAAWERSEEQEQANTFQESTHEFVEKIDANQEEKFILTGVLNTPVESGMVSLPKASLNILKKYSELHEYLNYSIKSSDIHVTASYNQTTKKILVTATTETGPVYENEITVVDASNSYPVSNSTYENKAEKYEIVEKQPYSILLGGSSSMENWSTSTADMKPLTTYNVGIGGTTVDMWIDSLCERLIYPNSPRAVVLYVGINNIIGENKDSGETTGHKVETLLTQIHERLPDTHIYYVLINSVPGYYVKYGEDFITSNSIVRNYAEGKSYITLIDAGTLLIKQSGVPNEAYFLTDGLHMSICGYEIWGKAVKEAVIEQEKILYSKNESK